MTDAFIDEIVANKDKYCWVPLCVDKRMLRGGQLYSLGHKMNPARTHFSTEQIGSFVNFWKDTKNGVSVLYGEARVPKRDDQVCCMLQKLYDAECLNVSFEIVSDHLQHDGNVVVIDASPENVLIGMAVVSTPAYPDASSAVLMVAEREVADETAGEDAQTDTELNGQEGESMDDEKMKLEEQEAKEPDEQEKTEAAEETPEEKGQPENKDDAATPEDGAVQDAECDPKKAEAEAVECPEENQQDTAELRALVEQLQQQVQELLPYREMVEASEKDSKMARLRAFAEKNGMNLEDEKVCAAIEALDAEALIDESMKEAPEAEAAEESHVQAASFDSMKMGNPREFLYERGTYKG